MMLKVRDFSETPGGRYINEGKWSGQEFRESVLKPLFRQALEDGVRIVINLDGTYGYSTGFLDEAFGGLSREFGNTLVSDHLDWVSTEEPYLIDEILDYIEEPVEQ